MTTEERAKAYAEERVNQMFCIPEEMPTEKQKANMMKGHEMTYIKIATEQKAIDDEEKKELVEAILDDISDNVCFDKFGRPFNMAEFRDKWIHKLEE